MQTTLPFPSEINPECPEQCELRGKSPAERELFFTTNLTTLFGGLWAIKLDGHPVATGYDEELPDMLLRFNEYIDGEDCPRRTGGMG